MVNKVKSARVLLILSNCRYPDLTGKLLKCCKLLLSPLEIILHFAVKHLARKEPSSARCLRWPRGREGKRMHHLPMLWASSKDLSTNRSLQRMCHLNSPQQVYSLTTLVTPASSHYLEQGWDFHPPSSTTLHLSKGHRQTGKESFILPQLCTSTWEKN